jgi:hypothetical protein
MKQDKPLKGDRLLEQAWGLIANAGWDAHTGNTDLDKSPGWHEAAIAWREEYFRRIGRRWLRRIADRLVLHILSPLRKQRVDAQGRRAGEWHDIGAVTDERPEALRRPPENRPRA